MESSESDRANSYASSRQLKITVSLGMGTDGSVWKAKGATGVSAIKAFTKRKNYSTEVECYRRLRENKVTQILGYSVPQLVHYDEQLMVVEMTVVVPPYILDFGKSYLDRRPDFSSEVIGYRQVQLREWWGDYLPQVRAIVRYLERLGIHYHDPKPGNIMPENWDPPLDD